MFVFLLSSLEGVQKPSHMIDILENDRFYVNSDSILINEDGILLQTDHGSKISIPSVFCDSQGCFVRFDTMLATIYPIIRCKNCNTAFSPNFFNRGKCPKCGMQN